MLIGGALLWQKVFFLWILMIISFLFSVLLVLIIIRRLYLTVGALWLPEPSDLPLPKVLPKVAVFIPAHNESKVIADCLDAIAHVDYPPALLDVFLIDDASTDTTAKVAKAFLKKIPGLKILSRDNKTGAKGKPAALNFALSKYKDQDICFFLDADSVVDPSAIKRAAANLANNKYGAVTGRLEPINPYDSVPSFYTAVESWTHQLTTLSPGSKMGLPCPVLGSNWAIKRRVLDKFGLGHDQLLEDTNLSVKMNARGHKILFDGKMKAFYEVPVGFGEYFKQHVGWGRGFSRIGRNNFGTILFGKGSFFEKLDLLIYSWGYLDRPILAAMILMAIINVWHPVFLAPVLLIIGALVMPFVQMQAALYLAKRNGVDHLRSLWGAPMFLVDLTAAVYAFYLDLSGGPARWYKTARRLDEKPGLYMQHPGDQDG